MKYDFVHLHNHSDYSLFKSMIKTWRLADRAKHLGMKAVALTDLGNLSGAVEFYNECRKNGIKPLIGSAFFFSSDDLKDIKKDHCHLILLAKNKTGYKNLIKLSSLSYLKNQVSVPFIDNDLLEKYNEGLICLSGNVDGEIPSLIFHDRLQEAEKRALYYKELFGNDSFYLELEDHGNQDEKKVDKILIELSKKLGIPLAAANDARYLSKEDASAFDILRLINTELCMGFKDDRTYNAEYYLKSEEEMSMLFKEIPEALINTGLIADMCELEIKDLKPAVPDAGLPAGYSQKKYITELAVEGFKKRYDNADSVIIKRLEHEIEVLDQGGFIGYVLIIYDIIGFAVKNNIPLGPGKGSSPGSLLLYCLGISNIDPVKYGLLFEKFYNEDKRSFPHIYIDFCAERKKEIFDHIIKKYSEDNAVFLMSFKTLNISMIIYFAGRASGISDSRIRQIIKIIKKYSSLYSMRETPKFKKKYAGFTETEKEILDASVKLKGVIYNRTLHNTGIAVCSNAITDIIPVQIIKNNRNELFRVSQVPLYNIEKRGPVMIEIMSLNIVTYLKKCTDLLADRGKMIDINNIKTDDPNVFKVFADGDAAGIFEFQKSGIIGYLKKLKPSSLEDLTALNAMYRPGVLGYIDSYIALKHKRKKPHYDHTLTEGILSGTYGLIIYQEQLMKILQTLAGYDPGASDIVRRILGRKKMDEIEKHLHFFTAGCGRNGIDKKTAVKIYNRLIDSIVYCFNKSHAASYAYLAYQCAYLKAYYPEEFKIAFNIK